MQRFFNLLLNPYTLLIIGAVFVHISYQLSVSTLAQLAARSLGRKFSNKATTWLGFSYIGGVGVGITSVLLSLLAFAAFMERNEYIGKVTVAPNMPLFGQLILPLLLALLFVVGFMTLLMYYRTGSERKLWLPTPIARYLLERTKETSSAVESYMLGIATVIGELPFIIAPMFLIVFVIVNFNPYNWLLLALGYAAVVTIPLFIVLGLLSSGRALAGVKRWRDDNKTFLQITSGLGLLLLAFYLVILEIGIIPWN